ncbi:RidA family protein [Variovorax sp. SRS16]|uniref:RidA family protein n=1 Tax=Variovorax sp. SRS16 TaxID=282217 RepID=UPI0013A5B43E|nr:RidA family protein [Variovorax sp. SRS16]
MHSNWGGSRAVKVGATIHVAGLMGVKDDGTLVSDVNLARQVDAVYANLKAALAEFGASLSNVVSETVFVTDIEQPYVMELVGRAYAQQPSAPARTICQVDKLLLPNAMIAVSCIATLEA